MARLIWAVLQWPIAFTWHVYARLVRLTSKITVVGEIPTTAAIFVNWHRHQTFLIPHHGSHRRWMLVSPAPMLEPVARFCRLSGLQLIRGTSGDRGKQARAELCEIILAGGSITLAVDGPAGPAFQVKRGCADIALQTGAPIVPVCFRSIRGLTIGWRWDYTLLPVPFDHITIAYGRAIGGSTESELLENVRKELTALDPLL